MWSLCRFFYILEEYMYFRSLFRRVIPVNFHDTACAFSLHAMLVLCKNFVFLQNSFWKIFCKRFLVDIITYQEVTIYVFNHGIYR